eukprot:5181834-Pyramimonas_sp.AAC.1
MGGRQWATAATARTNANAQMQGAVGHAKSLMKRGTLRQAGLGKLVQSLSQKDTKVHAKVIPARKGRPAQYFFHTKTKAAKKPGGQTIRMNLAADRKQALHKAVQALNKQTNGNFRVTKVFHHPAG